MSKRWRQVLIALATLAILFVGAQAIRPDRTNPPIDPNRTLRGQPAASPAAVAVIERSCNDCHSNATVWPSYTRIAPASWLMAYAVQKGRASVNFSEWAGYAPERQQKAMTESCQDVALGKMPGIYTMLHPEMRMSPQDVDAICSAALAMQSPGAVR